MEKTQVVAKSPDLIIEPKELKRLQEVANSANKGEPGALAELRKILEQRPVIWKECGNVAKKAEIALIELGSSSKGHFSREVVGRHMEDLRSRLADPDCDPLEKLLAERVAVCWLAVYTAQALAAAPAQGAFEDCIRGEEARKRLDGANRQFLQAIKTFAIVRKLLQPSPAPIDIASTLRCIRGRQEPKIPVNN